MARRVLTKFWQRYGENAQNNGAFACILYMARIDAPLALEWSAKLGGQYDDRVNQEAAQTLAETNTDGALELLSAVGARSALTSCSSSPSGLLPRIAPRPSNSPRRRRCKPERRNSPTAPARWPGPALLVRLGQKEGGLALINDAAAAAEQMGLVAREGFARGNVAGALAPFDLARALNLVEPMKEENDRDRYLGFIATALAESDPKRA